MGLLIFSSIFFCYTPGGSVISVPPGPGGNTPLSNVYSVYRWYIRRAEFMRVEIVLVASLIVYPYLIASATNYLYLSTFTPGGGGYASITLLIWSLRRGMFSSSTSMSSWTGGYGISTFSSSGEGRGMSIFFSSSIRIRSWYIWFKMGYAYCLASSRICRFSWTFDAAAIPPARYTLAIGGLGGPRWATSYMDSYFGFIFSVKKKYTVIHSLIKGIINRENHGYLNIQIIRSCTQLSWCFQWYLVT